MYGHFEQQPISICLVGDFNQKQQFLQKAQLSFKTSPEKSPYYVKYAKKFIVWPFLWLDNIERYNRPYQRDYRKELYCIKAIIYLDPTANQKAYWEELRDQSQCIAIELDIKKFNPKKDFYEIKQLIQSNQQSLNQFLNTITDRPVLVLMSNQDKQSAFAELPQDVIKTISAWTYLFTEKQFAKSIEKLEPANKSCMIQ